MTREQLEMVRNAAGEAGDLVQVYLCALALDRTTDSDDALALMTEADRRKALSLADSRKDRDYAATASRLVQESL